MNFLSSAGFSQGASSLRYSRPKEGDHEHLAAKSRFKQLEGRQRQAQIIEASINDYQNDYQNRQLLRAIDAVHAGRNVDNAAVIAHDECFQQFTPLGQQFAKKAIQFTEKAISLAEQGSSFNRASLHELAKHYDHLANFADQEVNRFKRSLENDAVSYPALATAQKQYGLLSTQAGSLTDRTSYAEKGIQFSQAAQSASSNHASAIDPAAEVVPYDRLAQYCFAMLEHPDQVDQKEQSHYEPLVAWAFEALKARDFRALELADALEKNIHTQERVAHCALQMQQCNNPVVRPILSRALDAYRAAIDSRNEFIEIRRSEMKTTERMMNASSDIEMQRVEVMAVQDIDYQSSVASDQSAMAPGGVVRSASPTELTLRADHYERAAQGFEKAAASEEVIKNYQEYQEAIENYQEAIQKLPDVVSLIKRQKPLKERAQEFLALAQEELATAYSELQSSDVGAAADSLEKVKVHLGKVEAAVAAVQSKAAGSRT